MSAHVALNLLIKLGKIDKMRGLPSILSLFLNEFNQFNNTKARIVDSISLYDIKITLKSYLCRKKVIVLSLCTCTCTQRCYERHFTIKSERPGANS